jgi:hypothetical protein
MGMNSLSPAFLSKIHDLHSSGCWLWHGEIRKPSGLPTFQKKLANRIMWEAHFGTIPAKAAIKTTCGAKHCLNPEHLQLGMAGKPPSGVDVRFWRSVRREEGVGCWIWTGAPHTSGYGRIGLHDLGRGMEYAHRYSFELHYGPLGEDKYVAHRCDVKLCVRPGHLFLSDSDVQNMADAATKDRIAHGERSGLSTYSDAEVAEVRRLHAIGMKNVDIVRSTGLSAPYVSQLCNRKRRLRNTTRFPQGSPGGPQLE